MLEAGHRALVSVQTKTNTLTSALSLRRERGQEFLRLTIEQPIPDGLIHWRASKSFGRRSGGWRRSRRVRVSPNRPIVSRIPSFVSRKPDLLHGRPDLLRGPEVQSQQGEGWGEVMRSGN